MLPFIRNEQQTGRIFQRRLIPRTSETKFFYSIAQPRIEEDAGALITSEKKKKTKPIHDYHEGSMMRGNDWMKRTSFCRDILNSESSEVIYFFEYFPRWWFFFFFNNYGEFEILIINRSFNIFRHFSAVVFLCFRWERQRILAPSSFRSSAWRTRGTFFIQLLDN